MLSRIKMRKTSLNDEGAHTKKHEWKKMKFLHGQMWLQLKDAIQEICECAFCLLHCIMIGVAGVEQ